MTTDDPEFQQAIAEELAKQELQKQKRVLVLGPDFHAVIPPGHYSKIIVQPGATIPGGMHPDVIVDEFVVVNDEDSELKTLIGSADRRLEFPIPQPTGAKVIMPIVDVPPFNR